VSFNASDKQNARHITNIAVNGATATTLRRLCDTTAADFGTGNGDNDNDGDGDSVGNGNGDGNGDGDGGGNGGGGGVVSVANLRSSLVRFIARMAPLLTALPRRWPGSGGDDGDVDGDNDNGNNNNNDNNGGGGGVGGIVAHQLFGVDVAVDARRRCRLLEVNTNPSFFAQHGVADEMTRVSVRASLGLPLCVDGGGDVEEIVAPSNSM
jgi:hypothetical protein